MKDQNITARITKNCKKVIVTRPVNKDDANGKVLTEIYNLTEAPEESLKKFRTSVKHGLILKRGGKYLICEIPFKYSRRIDYGHGQHCCVEGNRFCAKFSALSDEEGGCLNIRETIYIEFLQMVQEGLELFTFRRNTGVRIERLQVLKCSDYIKAKKS